MSHARRASRASILHNITEFAAAQHCVMTRPQLLAAGMSAAALHRALQDDHFQALHRGVYLVGPSLAPHSRAMAAVLACGETAVLGHFSAAALAQLLPKPPDDAPADVFVRTGDRRRPGIRVHHGSGLCPEEITRIEHIRVTTPARTLLDIAAHGSARELERAMVEAFARRLCDHDAIAAVVSRHPRAAGSARLRALLNGGKFAVTRSVAEKKFLALVRAGQLPPPEANVLVAGFEVDFYWRVHQFIAEIDGFAFHSSARSFERDRHRDAVLAAAGIRVMRVTWHQLTKEPSAVLVRLAQALVRASPI